MSRTPETSSLAGFLLTGSSWALAGTIVSTAGGFFANLLLAHLLFPTELGAFFLAAALVMVAAVLARAGLDRVVVRLVAQLRAGDRESEVPRHVRHLLKLAGISVIAVGFLVFFGMPVVARLFESPGLAAHRLVISIWAACEGYRIVVSEVHRGVPDVRRATVHGNALRTLVMITTLLGWKATGAEITLGRALMVAAGASALTLGLAAWSVKAREELWGEPRRTAPVSGLLTAGLPFLVSSLSTVGLSQGDLWIVAGFRSTAEVAVYGAALRVATLLALPLVIANAVLAPLISHLYAQKRQEDLQRLIRTSAGVAALPTAIFFGLVAIFGTEILGSLFGEFYADGAWVLLFLALGQLGNVVLGPCGTVLLLTGRGAVAMWVTLVASLLTLFAEAASATRFGMVGIAVCSGLGVVVQNCALTVATRKCVGIWTVAELRPRNLTLGIRALRHQQTGSMEASASEE